MIKNTRDSYGSIMILLHWLIGLLVIGMLGLGFYLSDFLPDNHPFRPELVGLHKSVGLTILVLMIIRLLWRFINPQPLLPMTVPTWEKIAARSVQALFYITLFVMPISGMLMSSYGGHTVLFWGWFNAAFPVAKNVPLARNFFTVHGVVAWVMIGLLVLHIGAAIKHHFIEKNNVVRRMLPGYRSPDLFGK